MSQRVGVVGGGHLGEQIKARLQTNRQNITVDTVSQGFSRKNVNVILYTHAVESVSAPGISSNVQHSDDDAATDPYTDLPQSDLQFGNVKHDFTNADDNSVVEQLVDLRKAKEFVRLNYVDAATGDATLSTTAIQGAQGRLPAVTP